MPEGKSGGQKKRRAQRQSAPPRRSLLAEAGDFLSTFFTALAVLAAAALLLAALTGAQLLCVQSDSMVPTFSKGALLVVRPVEFSDIQPGDIVTYTLDSHGTLVTHRVTEVNRLSGSVTTKGDANDVTDAPVRKERIVGKVVFTAPGIGPFFAALTDQGNRTVVVACFALAALVLILWETFPRGAAPRHKPRPPQEKTREG